MNTIDLQNCFALIILINYSVTNLKENLTTTEIIKKFFSKMKKLQFHNVIFLINHKCILFLARIKDTFSAFLFISTIISSSTSIKYTELTTKKSLFYM